MRTTRYNHAEPSSFARLAAAILFLLVVGMGYAVSPRVEGAVGLPPVAQDQEESAELAPECVSHGLVFSDCGMDF